MNEDTRQWYIAHHICTACGQRDARRGRRKCPECAEKELERQKKRYSDPEVRVKRIEYAREYRRKRAEERKSRGECIRCGRPSDGYYQCARCRYKERAQQRKARERQGKISKDERFSGYYCLQCCVELPEWRENKLCDKCLELHRRQGKYVGNLPLADNHQWKLEQEAHYEWFKKWTADNTEGVV